MKRLQGNDWISLRPYLKAVRYEKSNSGQIKGVYKSTISDAMFYHWLNDEEKSALQDYENKTSSMSFNFKRKCDYLDKSLKVGDLVAVNTRDREKFYGVVIKLYPVEKEKKDRVFVYVINPESLDKSRRHLSYWKRFCCDEEHGYFAELAGGDFVHKISSPETRYYSTYVNKTVDISEDGVTTCATSRKFVKSVMTTYFCQRDDLLGTPGFVFVTESSSNTPNDIYGCCIKIPDYFAGDVTSLLKRASYKLRIARLESKL